VRYATRHAANERVAGTRQACRQRRETAAHAARSNICAKRLREDDRSGCALRCALRPKNVKRDAQAARGCVVVTRQRRAEARPLARDHRRVGREFQSSSVCISPSFGPRQELLSNGRAVEGGQRKKFAGEGCFARRVTGVAGAVRSAASRYAFCRPQRALRARRRACAALRAVSRMSFYKKTCAAHMHVEVF